MNRRLLTALCLLACESSTGSEATDTAPPPEDAASTDTGVLPDAAGADAGAAPDAAPPGDAAPPDVPAIPDAAPLPEPPPALAPGIYPFAGTALDLPSDDLRRLDTLLASARVIGIGESIHTTAGQFRARNRVLRDLIEHGGVRMLAFESSRTGVRDALDTWLRTCEGPAEDAIQASLHTIWWDVSTPEILRWLCEYNQAHPDDPVRASGFDIRQPWTDVPALRQYVETHDPEGAPLLSGLDTCLGVGYADERAFFSDPAIMEYYEQVTPMPEGPHVACQRGATPVFERLASRREALVAATSEAAYEEARMALVAAVAFDETIFWVSRGNLRRGNTARDEAMYDLFATQRRLSFPGVRTAIWAHNGHIMRGASELTNNQWTGVESLGTRLGAALGAEYAALGQVSLETRYNWFQGPQVLPPPADDSLEARLGALGADHLLVSPAEAAADPTGALPDVPMDVGFDTDMHPAAHYDVILWHRTSEGAEPFANPFEM